MCIFLKKNSFYSLLLMMVSFALFAKEENQDEWDVNNPPGESIKVPIKTNEGTWMNVDVSPDGKSIVFDLLGDIYLMPMDGGKAVNLTNSMAWDMQARFSPDGRRLVFTSDQGGGDNIWVMDTDGNNAYQVTKEKFRLLNSPAWSPDGEYIVARKHFTGMRSAGAGEIWMYHHSGGKGVQLNKRPNEQKDLGEPIFTSDGKYVLYSRDSTPGAVFEYSKDSNNQIYEVFAIELATGKVNKWISGPGGAVRPTPSPDGKSLAFVRRIRNNTALHIQDRESGEITVLYDNLERDMQETWAIHGVYPTFDWTPDGKSLIFYAKGGIHRIDVNSRAVTQIPFEVDDAREVRAAVHFKNNPSLPEFQARMLRWLQPSPQGDRAVFQALGYIYTVKLPDGRPKRLTRQKENFELYPRFSADGKHIIYTTWNDQTLSSVRISDLKGNSRSVTSKKGHFINPSLSPDGEKVVFEAIAGGYITTPLYSQDTGLFVAEVKSGKTHKLSETGTKPFFSKDNKRVFFAKTKRDKEVITTQLVSTDLGGHEVREHYQGKWITDFSISPNEKWLAFIQNYQVYVTPFIHSGKYISTGSKADNLPLKRFSEFAGLYLSWNKQSNALSWAMGPDLYTQKLDEEFDFLASTHADEGQKPSVHTIQMEVETDIPESKIALVGATVITMNASQQVINGATIIVDKNRIVSVGKKEQVQIPADAQVIDVSGKFIIPGLVDVHWHGPYANNQIIPQTNWHALASLAFGVTTEHNPSADTEAVFAASEMQKAGMILAPRTFSTGTILYGATHFFTAPVNSLEDALGHLKRMKAVGAFSVKSYNQPRRDQRQQVLEAARQTGILVFPEGGSLFTHNISMVVDGHTGIEHSIPMADIYEDVLQLWSGTQTGYTPTLGVGYGGIWGERYWYDTTDVWRHPLLKKYVPREILEPVSVRRTKAPIEDYNHINNARVANKLQQRGVDVLLGAHGQREGLAAHWELWMFVQGGMSPMNALKAGTIDGAKYLGMEESLGSIEKEKLADLVVLHQNPLEDIHNSDKVDKVMLNGRLYDANTLNQIAPKKQKREPFFFE